MVFARVYLLLKRKAIIWINEKYLQMFDPKEQSVAHSILYPSDLFLNISKKSDFYSTRILASPFIWRLLEKDVIISACLRTLPVAIASV